MSDEEIKRLRIKRGAIKGQLTRFCSYLSDKENHTDIEQLEYRLKRIEDAFNEFDGIQVELEFLSESEVAERDELENAFFENIALAKGILRKNISTLPAHVQVNSDGTTYSGTQANCAIDPNVSIKLPTINLPTFAGSYDTWVQFRETFVALIHENAKLSDIQKLHYLKSCLRNEAQKLVQSLEITSDSYSVAWNMLNTRYDNKRIIINNHIKALFELPIVTKDSHVSLRHLLDKLNQHLNSLNKLKLPTEHWDALIIHLVSTRLDNNAKKEWETSLDNDTFPTLQQLQDFLTKRCLTLETLFNNPAKKEIHGNFKKVRNVEQNYAVIEGVKCAICDKDHYVYHCQLFAKMSINDKYDAIRKCKLCANCLRTGHLKYQCKSLSRCRKCSQKHNTLLHQVADSSNNINSKNTINSPAIDNPSEQLGETSCVSYTHNQILLPTARVLISDIFNNYHECVALLDSGSQSNFISKQLCNKLGLKQQAVHIPITGISETVTKITHRTSANIRSRVNNFTTNLQCLVLDRISERIPLLKVNVDQIAYPDNIELADPHFDTPKNIDILLGAGIFYNLLAEGRIILGKTMPVLQNTVFGWVLAGPVGMSRNHQDKSTCHFSKISNIDLDNRLREFWRVEEVPQAVILSPEAKRCEALYTGTTTRSTEGRFIVKLPFKQEICTLGDSKSIALKRFLSLESRLHKSQELKEYYCNFMDEYRKLGHMTSQGILNLQGCDKASYILPHHAVFKASSTTTKCRVVFDASAKTIGGASLNDNLLVGPKLQDDLFYIVLRLRLHKYTLNADIKMMFRQIIIHKDDRPYQLILWRDNRDEPIQVYELNTVTYGVASSPYLAQRCLLQLATEFASIYPQTCKIIHNSFYMDDLLVSVESTAQALKLYRELTEILGSAGFHLRKWSSNSKYVLDNILENNDNSDHLVQFSDDKDVKTLGLVWKPTTDTISYAINAFANSGPVTKRKILAVIAQTFDPLGLVGPVIIKAKILMQHLWKLRVDWDAPLPPDLQNSWLRFTDRLRALNHVNINRQVLCDNPIHVELHGFSDASERGYGSCIYLKSVDKHGTKVSNLLCAKSKVAPLNKSITLPRLELMGAALLAKLVQDVKENLGIPLQRCFYYTDSTIVLSWLKIEPSQLKTFVANRVSQINEIVNVDDWKHVQSQHNAADLISRGVNPDELINMNIWWHGPEFILANETADVPLTQLPIEEIPDVRKVTTTFAVQQGEDFDLCSRYSSLSKLQRVLAYCLRFKNACLYKQYKSTNIIEAGELEIASITAIKIAQRQVYKHDIDSLIAKGRLKNNSSLLNLHPFIDEMGVIRVGGRLKHAEVDYDQRHPIILPKTHQLTRLLIKHFHERYLHTGPQNLLSLIRLKYWPIGGKGVVKSVLKSCIKCFRAKPTAGTFLMGNLPSARVNPARPFVRCGVDYAGPIFVKDGTLRKCKMVKTYFCVFVCLATRAIHIELVGNLTTDSFLNALKRFTSRRGKPYEIHSDNGSNFIGANNHFKELHNLLSDKQHREQIITFLAPEGITWRFIPPKSPHMGGLWEAAVKQTKYHLRRILGNACVTYEEMNTLLIQIEGCLNSRPLTQLSNDPEDYYPLTPAHFIVGESLQATPQSDVTHIKYNRLSRYERIQQLLQHFWKRWSREYLSSLQRRAKWKETKGGFVKVGQLVVLVEDNIPPLRWPMARIVQLHAGTDEEVRVVSVKLPSGQIFKRAVNKICILPIEV